MNKKLEQLFKFDANTGAEGGGAAGGAAGAGAAGASAAGGAGTPPPATGNFYDAFSPELKDFTIQKGFKDPQAVVDAYRNFEKMKGVPQERLLTLPEKADDKAAWDQIYERLGKPKDGNYSFEAKPDVTGKDTFGDWAKNAFKDANLTDSQAKALVESYRKQTEVIVGELTAAQQARLNQQNEALKKEWGNAFDQNTTIARNAAQALGIKPETVSAMEKDIGMAETLKFFKTIGDKTGEGKFRQGEGKSTYGKMDPDSAKAQLSALKADATFMAKYAKKDAEAVKTMGQLFADAYPGEQHL